MSVDKFRREFSNAELHRTKVFTVTSAQVLALFATPVTILGATGANRMIILEGIILHKPAGTAYGGIAAGEDLTIKYTGGAELARFETTGFLDAATAQTRYARGYAAASAINDVTPDVNTGLDIALLIAEIITGDSPIRCKIFYRDLPSILL